MIGSRPVEVSALQLPRLMVSAVSGGGGKTLLSLGLAGALRACGCEVMPFKKGPDYIDAAWLTAAAGRAATNIDPYLLSGDRARSLLAWRVSRDAPAQALDEGRAVALIEGNRGFYDGMDIAGSCSTAQLARELGTPVVLSLDVTKMTRTAAAVVQGIAGFEKGVTLAGVVLNRVGRSRHAEYARRCIETYTDVPVLGALPRLAGNPLPERHMGLASLRGDSLSETARESLEKLARFVQEHADVDALLAAARGASPLEPAAPFWPDEPVVLKKPPTIGYVRDEILWFYYRENLEALERAGARLVRLSWHDDQPWRFSGEDGLDAVYLGGGFPEDYLDALHKSPHVAQLAAAARRGLPVYAECGGLMVLAHSISRNGQTWPMAGVLPVSIEFTPRPQGLGYIEATVTAQTPYYAQGTRIRGHEFHYSRAAGPLPECTCLSVGKGTGLGQGRDAVCVRHVWGSYTHIFAPACPQWAQRFVALAGSWREKQTG